MASIVGLAAWAAALGPRTVWEGDRIGQVVGVGIPDPVEDTNPVEESCMASEGSHEAGNLAGLRGQNADLAGEGSIGENTVAVETLVDLADEAVVAEIAVDFAVDFAEEVEKEIAAAAGGSEIAAPTKECRLGERSACELWSALWKYVMLFRCKEYLKHIRRKATEISTWFCALGGIFCDLHPKYFITYEVDM